MSDAQFGGCLPDARLGAIAWISLAENALGDRPAGMFAGGVLNTVNRSSRRALTGAHSGALNGRSEATPGSSYSRGRPMRRGGVAGYKRLMRIS
jgi:hypothetical protein